MASGISSAATLDFPLKELYAVELVPEVIRAARENFAPWNAKLFSDPRVKIVQGDGRVVLARLPGKFDAIICDLFFPTEDGTANLYSRDFFDEVLRRLAPGGVFCLWLPCYQHDQETAGMVVRTFADAFPNAVIVRANLDPQQPVIGLLGSNEPIPLSREFLQNRIGSPAARQIAPSSPYVTSVENMRLLFAGDLHACDPDFSAALQTNDDHPMMAFLGPRQSHSRLEGMPFLDWIGKRFLRPLYPSCDLGGDPPAELLSAVRAGSYYFAAAVAASVAEGDRRTPEVRMEQVINYLRRAQNLSPAVKLPDDALGQ
jgi:spermidine synthase